MKLLFCRELRGWSVLLMLCGAMAVALIALTQIGGQQVTAQAIENVLTEEAIEKAESSAGDLWLAIGPDMQVLPNGTYRFIRIPADPSQQVETTTVTTGGGVSPVPPPPVGDLAAKTKAALAKVTDPDKATTAKNLAVTYEEFIKSADSGQLTNAGQLATAVNLVTTLTTTGKAGWVEFSTLVSTTLSSAASVPAVSASLKVFVAELKK